VLTLWVAGKVRFAIHEETLQEVAIKIIRKDHLLAKPIMQRVVAREMSMMKLLNHPHVVRMYDMFETADHMCVQFLRSLVPDQSADLISRRGCSYLVLEYAPNGELFDYILSNKSLTEADACAVFQQLISGLDYCHRHHIWYVSCPGFSGPVG
jgi:BR serine/threonine kinase